MRDYVKNPALAKRPVSERDVGALLKLMWETWNDVFRKIFGPAERSLVGELRAHRNNWAHQESFSSDNAYRAFDSVGRLLAAVSAPQSGDLEKIKMELLPVRFDEQARSERRKQAASAIDPATSQGIHVEQCGSKWPGSRGGGTKPLLGVVPRRGLEPPDDTGNSNSRGKLC
jgi:hypothetical protein